MAITASSARVVMSSIWLVSKGLIFFPPHSNTPKVHSPSAAVEPQVMSGDLLTFWLSARSTDSGSARQSSM